MKELRELVKRFHNYLPDAVIVGHNDLDIKKIQSLQLPDFEYITSVYPETLPTRFDCAHFFHYLL